LAKWQGRLAPLQLTLHSFPASRRSNRAVWFCSLALPPKPLQVKKRRRVYYFKHVAGRKGARGHTTTRHKVLCFSLVACYDLAPLPHAAGG
jgi:hypothetical protein